MELTMDTIDRAEKHRWPEELRWRVATKKDKKEFAVLAGPGATKAEYTSRGLWESSLHECVRVAPAVFAFDAAFGHRIHFLKKHHGIFRAQVQAFDGTLDDPVVHELFPKALPTQVYFTSGGELTILGSDVVRRIGMVANQVSGKQVIIEIKLAKEHG
jgi:hypothetical protein